MFLILVVFVSYGQILWMQPWQDDNALFFKLAHIQEPAGFLGKGPFGEGVYKYAVTPFIPIYKIFGYYIPVYFALALILYIATTLVIYKSLSLVLSEKGGRIAGFIYAFGYVISDGAWRLANSVTTSISVIIASLFLVCYWKYYKEGKLNWYVLALLSFFAGLEFSLSRMHYFVAVAVSFEIIFLAFRKPLKSTLFSSLRLLPFLILFKMKVLGNDPRSAGTASLALDLLRGKFDSLSGFLSSLANLIIPDWLSNHLFRSSTHQLFIILLGVFVLFLGLIRLLRFHKEQRRLFLFFSLWALANLYAYSSYLPSVTFATTDRYLAHSFLALTAIFALLYVNFDKKTLSGKIGIILIVILGLGNLINGFIFQADILRTRSFPVKSFYASLKTYLPTINKGDVLYFDVSKDQGEVYKDAISAAMMPDSTSLAWRYGIDRYDFTLMDDFKELLQVFEKDKIRPESIHSFFFSQDGLIETTNNLRDYFSNKIKLKQVERFSKKSNVILKGVSDKTSWMQPELVVNFKKPVESDIPQELTITLLAMPIRTSEINFPLFSGDKIPDSASPWRDEKQRNLALEYQKAMQYFLARSTFEVNSEWRGNSVKNINDNDPSTFWQSDRVLWQKKEDYIKVKLGETQSVGVVAWMNNTYSGSIPTNYEIDVSQDGISWLVAKKIADTKIPETQAYQFVSFDPIFAKFIRMKITETAGGDSPMISEFRVIPGNLASLNLAKAQDFLENPYFYVSDATTFDQILNPLGRKGKIRVFWMGDKDKTWLTSKDAQLDVLYDGKMHEYKFRLPLGGTYIDKIKIAEIKVPGQIVLSELNFHGLNFNENH